MEFEVFQLWSQPGTRLVRLRSVPEQWVTPTRYRPEFGLLRGWVKEGSEWSRELNWTAVAGMVFSIGVSGGFWVGIAWLVAHWLRPR